MALTLGLGGVTLVSVVRPLRNMVRVVQRHARDEDGEMLQPTQGRDEIGQLSRAIVTSMENHARKAREDAQERQRQAELRWKKIRNATPSMQSAPRRWNTPCRNSAAR